jgi:hypothetical protein
LSSESNCRTISSGTSQSVRSKNGRRGPEIRVRLIQRNSQPSKAAVWKIAHAE